ncbi:MAG: Fic family protein, partial [Chloroflexota bacterium]
MTPPRERREARRRQIGYLEIVAPPIVTTIRVGRVALLHLNVVAIHPFQDGNGRTARVVATGAAPAGAGPAGPVPGPTTRAGPEPQALGLGGTRCTPAIGERVLDKDAGKPSARLLRPREQLAR